MLPLVVVSAALGSTQTTIHDLQLQVTDVGSGGSDCYPSGASSNTEYSVDGVVTAVQAPNGFYMQMYDLQPVSWSGIWVYAPQSGTGSIVWPANLAVGDSVHVTGTCSEYFGMTEINAHEGPSITRSGSGTQYIDPISVTTGAIGTTCSDSAEPYEGMLVSLSNVVVTSAPDRWGRVGIDDGTGLTRLDDDVFEADDLLVRHYGNAIIGATLTTLTGVVRFQFGTYAVFPRSANDIIFGAAGTLAPSPPPHVDCVQHGKDFRSPDRSCRFPPMVAIADDDLASDQGMMWFEGMHIYTPTLATPEDCQALCNEHRTCEYWSYEAEYGKHLCYLKQAYEDPACNVYSDWTPSSCGGGTGQCSSGPARCGNAAAEDPSCHHACEGGNDGCGGNLGLGDGDCDVHSDCASGLVCGTDNCMAFRDSAGWPTDGPGWDLTDDCCYFPGGLGSAHTSCPSRRVSAVDTSGMVPVGGLVAGLVVSLFVGLVAGGGGMKYWKEKHGRSRTGVAIGSSGAFGSEMSGASIGRTPLAGADAAAYVAPMINPVISPLASSTA